MVKFLIFIFLLLLDNLILPALIGPKQFLITPVFIWGLLVYGNGWRTLLHQVIPFVLITEFFAGESLGHLIIPFGLTGAIYLVCDKFINLSQNLRQRTRPLSGLIPGILILIVFNYAYSGLFILIDTSYNLSISWHELTVFLKNSLLSLLIWSILISVIFKYVLKKK